MSETMLKLGNYPEATALQNTGIEMQRMRNGQRISDQYFSAAKATSGQPATSAAPASAPPQSSAAAPGSPSRLPTIREILAANKIPNDQWDAAAPSIARQLGIGENDPVNTKDSRVSRVLGPAIGWLKKNRIGEVVQGDGDQATPASSTTPQATPSQRVSRGFSDAGIPAHGVPAGTQAPLSSECIVNTNARHDDYKNYASEHPEQRFTIARRHANASLIRAMAGIHGIFQLNPAAAPAP